MGATPICPITSFYLGTLSKILPPYRLRMKSRLGMPPKTMLNQKLCDSCRIIPQVSIRGKGYREKLGWKYMGNWRLSCGKNWREFGVIVEVAVDDVAWALPLARAKVTRREGFFFTVSASSLLVLVQVAASTANGLEHERPF